MSIKKSTFSINMDKISDRIIKPSVFARIVNEIEPTEIPAKFIRSVVVQYHDGNMVEIRGEEISCPIPLSKNASWNRMEKLFKKMRDIKITIDSDKLEQEINELVEQHLGKWC